MTLSQDDLQALYRASKKHRNEHGCEAYTFEDGIGLSALVEKLAPQRVLELGTAIGYAACLMASSTPTTHVDTIEGDPLHVDLARKTIAAVDLSARIKVHSGDFLQVIKLLTTPYDVVFFDGYAPNAQLLAAMRNLLKESGTLICGNLGLAGVSERQHIMSELQNETKWQTQFVLEQGRTAVARKIT